MPFSHTLPQLFHQQRTSTTYFLLFCALVMMTSIFPLKTIGSGCKWVVSEWTPFWQKSSVKYSLIRQDNHMIVSEYSAGTNCAATPAFHRGICDFPDPEPPLFYYCVQNKMILNRSTFLVISYLMLSWNWNSCMHTNLSQYSGERGRNFQFNKFRSEVTLRNTAEHYLDRIKTALATSN